jgi:zinc transporter 2
VLAFLISLFAIWIARRPAGGALTWGSHRYEMVGAVLSVVLIWILTVVLCMEAVDRILRPEEVDGRVMFVTALLGLLVNLGMMKILHQDVGGHGGHSHSHGGHSHGSHENLNVSAAFIHVVGDLVQSIGVMIAAAVIWAQPALTIVDPICTFVFSILVLFTTYGVMRAALTSALGSAPAHVSLPALARDLQALPGVRALYGLHVWEYGGAGDKGRVALEAHLVVDSGGAMAGALAGALGVCGAHGITHPTVQVEPAGARGGVSDAAGASLEVYEEGRAPADTLVADLVAAVTGWRWGSAGRAQRAGMLYRLVPPAWGRQRGANGKLA